MNKQKTYSISATVLDKEIFFMNFEANKPCFTLTKGKAKKFKTKELASKQKKELEKFGNDFLLRE